MKLEDDEVSGNYVIALHNCFSELSRRFNTQSNIKVDELMNLAMNLESSEEESKVRNNKKTTAAASYVNPDSKENGGRISCFKCGKPNHIANECFSQQRICYNCGKLGSHEATSIKIVQRQL